MHFLPLTPWNVTVSHTDSSFPLWPMKQWSKHPHCSSLQLSILQSYFAQLWWKLNSPLCTTTPHIRSQWHSDHFLPALPIYIPMCLCDDCFLCLKWLHSTSGHTIVLFLMTSYKWHFFSVSLSKILFLFFSYLLLLFLTCQFIKCIFYFLFSSFSVIFIMLMLCLHNFIAI